MYCSCLQGDITHMENGREPNAGVTVIPYVLFPVFFIGIAYIGNIFAQNLGLKIAFSLIGIIIISHILSIPKSLKRYNELLKEREVN